MRFYHLLLVAGTAAAAAVPGQGSSSSDLCCCCDLPQGAIVCNPNNPAGANCKCHMAMCPEGAPTMTEGVALPTAQPIPSYDGPPLSNEMPPKKRTPQADGESGDHELAEGQEWCCCCILGKDEVSCKAQTLGDECICNSKFEVGEDNCPAGSVTVYPNTAPDPTDLPVGDPLPTGQPEKRTPQADEESGDHELAEGQDWCCCCNDKEQLSCLAQPIGDECKCSVDFEAPAGSCPPGAVTVYQVMGSNAMDFPDDDPLPTGHAEKRTPQGTEESDDHELAEGQEWCCCCNDKKQLSCLAQTIGDECTCVPDFETPADTCPEGAATVYPIRFQDSLGSPTDPPLQTGQPQ